MMIKKGTDSFLGLYIAYNLNNLLQAKQFMISDVMTRTKRRRTKKKIN